MIIWNRKVYKGCYKSINKGLRAEFKNYFEILHTDIKRNFDVSIKEDEGEEKLINQF